MGMSDKNFKKQIYYDKNKNSSKYKNFKPRKKSFNETNNIDSKEDTLET